MAKGEKCVIDIGHPDNHSACYEADKLLYAMKYDGIRVFIHYPNNIEEAIDDRHNIGCKIHAVLIGALLSHLPIEIWRRRNMEEMSEIISQIDNIDEVRKFVLNPDNWYE
jgi:hypothetical protein